MARTVSDEILRAVREVDAWLDSDVHPDYQAQPLAQDWARTAKAAEEAGEAIRALIGATGQNPRKGVIGDRADVCEELADTACAALFGIQHLLKDEHATWICFLAALAKADKRVPR